MKITKGLTSTGNIVAETPKYLFDRISSIFNFSLDACALPENAKCESYYTPEDDGLSKPWGGYGATLPMEEKSRHGSKKPMRSRRRNTTTSYSCYCQQEQIQNGGGSMCRARRRSSSSREE